MIKSITIKNYLDESIKIDLIDGEPEHGLIIKDISGLGPPKATINMSDVSTSDGSIYNSARVDKRNITMTIGFLPALSIEDTRQRMYKYFPIKKPLTFIIETDNRIVETIGYVESNEPDIFSSEESTQISLLCEDSYFYSSGDNAIKSNKFFGIDPQFEFEFENESLTESLLEFGNIENLSEKNIIYDGDVEVGVNITINATGNIGDINIYNSTTREIMKINSNIIKDITGSSIIKGDEIIISTTKNNHKISLIRNGIYINILNALDRNSDWIKLIKGDNIFAYSVSSGAENIEFKIEYRLLYEGV